MSPPRTREDLSVDQTAVYDVIIDWSTGNAGTRGELLTVGGLAGTGKTSLLSVFAGQTKLLVAYVAYTGRAASNLSRKFAALGIASTAKTMLPQDGSEHRASAVEQYELRKNFLWAPTQRIARKKTTSYNTHKSKGP